MVSTSSAVLFAITLPLLALISNLLIRQNDNLREAVTFIVSVLTFGVVGLIASGNTKEPEVPIRLFSVMPGLDLAFHVEPLGLIFAIVASGLWIVTHLYAIGYMRGAKEINHGRFFAAFSLAISATLAIAFAANMFTLFLFYELLTISTYPLVTHKQNAESKAGGRIYLGLLMGTSIVFLLVAIIWTWVLAGTLDFTLGGILAGKVDGTMAAVLLALYAFGIGKAALMPFHRWLPAAMVAPTPVSALLHAVAVVKAGVFTMLKVGVYIFGIGFLAETGASIWLIWLATFSIVAASIVAMTKDNLKARLAYSTISQLSYITLGMALATSMGVIGGGIHIAMHAVGKITLFMCAGAIYVATKKTKISEMAGLGYSMPLVFVAFFIGSLSIIGIPPLGGTWGKWYLMVGAADAGQLYVIAALILSSLLNIAYLLPIVVNAFFVPAEQIAVDQARASLLCTLPPVLTAIGCLILFFYAANIQELLTPLTLFL